MVHKNSCVHSIYTDWKSQSCWSFPEPPTESLAASAVLTLQPSLPEVSKGRGESHAIITVVVTATEIGSVIIPNAFFLQCYLSGLQYHHPTLRCDGSFCQSYTASPPAGSMYFFLRWQADRESGMDSKGCSLGRDKALVSTPWAWALLWIITSLSGVAAVYVCVRVCARVCACVRLCACVHVYVHACLLVTEWARGKLKHRKSY